MSRSYIGRALRDQVTKDARHRCGYCLTSARITGAPLEIDHIVPESLGGLTVRENLWLACSMCNDHKGNRIAAVDPRSGEEVRIFDPRRQLWEAISSGAQMETSSSARRRRAELPSQPFA